MTVCEYLCPIHKQQICCAYCTERQSCSEVCDECESGYPEVCSHRVETGGKELTPAEQKVLPVMQAIKNIVLQKKKLEAKEKDLKENLKAAMEEYGVKSFDNELLKVTYIAATTQTKIDSAALKKKYPAVAAECSKTNTVSAYVKVEVKDG